jgi:SAM-dependent methyltransferase
MVSDLRHHYDAGFYSTFSDGAQSSAAVIVPLVMQFVQPVSVLDVGCGTGAWLAEWKRAGVADILGVDGQHVDRAALQIEADSFRAVDLRGPFSLDRRFDLVQSLEVAEHLDEACADQFVRSLARHADTVLFSAAIPGQGGVHHVNEQWPSYWIDRFDREGFSVFDVVRPMIWTDARVETWYRQNIFLFSRTLALPSATTCTDMVHPELWQARRSSPPLTLRQLTRALPAATVKAVKHRRNRAIAKMRAARSGS